MTSYFPDINVWIALTALEHTHNGAATRWLNTVDSADRLIFSRFTQLGFLRLLTNTRAIERALTTSRAWSVYDEWPSDPRVEFHDEPQSLHSAFRQATAPFSD